MAPRARSGLRGLFEDVLSLDLRSLAVYRVGLSLVLLYDLLDRSRDFVAHYSDQGVVPAEQALAMFGRGVYASLHFHLSGSVVALGCLLGLAALCGGALLVGYRTRLVTMLSWYLLASLQVRNHWVNGASGDALLVALLFWGIFLPLGERWSLDARRRGAAPGGNRVFRVATAAYIGQLLVLYLSTGLLKSGETWADGSALHYALNIAHFETPFTSLLRDQSWAHPFLTYATRGFEVAGPLLLLVPVPAVRMLAVVLFTAFHVSLALFLNVGLFPVFCIAAWLALLPGALFDRWLPALQTRLGTRLGTPGSGVRTTSAFGEVAQPAKGFSRLLDFCLVVPLFFVVAQAAVKLGWFDLGYGRGMPPIAHTFGQMLRLNQNWAMFAPDPSRYSFRLGVEGRLANGDWVDAFGNAPLAPLPEPREQAGPANQATGSSRSYRWRAYTWTALLTRPERPGLEASHRDFAAYLCREWNASHSGPERLVALRSIGHWRHTDATGARALQPTALYAYDCRGVGGLLWAAAQKGQDGPGSGASEP